MDATSSPRPVQDYAEGLPQASSLNSRPLAGKRIGIIKETIGAGVTAGVSDAFARAARHLESLGADVDEVRPHPLAPLFKVILPCIFIGQFAVEGFQTAGHLNLHRRSLPEV